MPEKHPQFHKEHPREAPQISAKKQARIYGCPKGADEDREARNMLLVYEQKHPSF